MKNFVIVAVLLLGSIGLVWFIMGDNSTSTDSTITLGEDAELDMSEESDTPIVTADPVATVNGEEISNADFTAQQTQILTAQGSA